MLTIRLAPPNIFDDNEDRADTFAPIKNSPYKAAGHSDSPNSARNLVSALHANWVAAALARGPGGEESARAFAEGVAAWNWANPLLAAVEISPLVSYGGEGLEALLAIGAGGLVASLPLCIVAESEKANIRLATKVSAFSAAGETLGLEVATSTSTTPRLSTNAAGDPRAWPTLDNDAPIAATTADRAAGRLSATGGDDQSSPLCVVAIAQ